MWARSQRLRHTALKRVVTRSPQNSELELDAPHWSITLHSNVAQASVLLTGDVGITPVLSMISTHDHTKDKIFGFYSINSPKTPPSKTGWSDPDHHHEVQ